MPKIGHLAKLGVIDHPSCTDRPNHCPFCNKKRDSSWVGDMSHCVFSCSAFRDIRRLHPSILDSSVNPDFMEGIESDLTLEERFVILCGGAVSRPAEGPEGVLNVLLFDDAWFLKTLPKVNAVNVEDRVNHDVADPPDGDDATGEVHVPNAHKYLRVAQFLRDLFISRNKKLLSLRLTPTKAFLPWFLLSHGSPVKPTPQGRAPLEAIVDQ